jgi:hypothetical protein
MPEGITPDDAVKPSLVLRVWRTSLAPADQETTPQAISDRYKFHSNPPSHHSALFQQIGAYACTTDVVGVIEVDLNELAEAAAVVVAQRLGIAKGLQDRVGLQTTPAATHDESDQPRWIRVQGLQGAMFTAR